MADKKERPLTIKQRRFIEQYLKCYEGKKAAMRVGYTEASAAATATRLLKDSRVQVIIQETIRKGEHDLQDLVAENYRVALGEADGKILKSADKIAAMDKIYRLSGMYKDKMDVTGMAPPTIIFLDSPDDDEGLTIDMEPSRTVIE